MSRSEKRGAAPPDPPLAARSPKAPLIVFGWGFLVLLGTSALSIVLAEKGLARVALCALCTEWMCGRAGVPWINPMLPAPPTKRMVRAVLTTIGLAAAIAFASVAIGVATGALATRAQQASTEGLLFSFLSAAFFGMQTELTEHGLVFAMLASVHTKLSPSRRHAMLVAVGVAASLAGSLGHRESGWAMAASASIGAVCAAFWSLDGGGLRAVAMRGATSFFLGSFVRLGPIAVMGAGRKALASTPEASLFTCLCALAALSLVRPSSHARTEGA